MAEKDNDFGKMISDAMADPRFGDIFSMLKGKADKGELDLSSVASLLGGKKDGEDGEPKSNDSQSTFVKGKEDKLKPSSDGKDKGKIPDILDLIGPMAGLSGGGKKAGSNKHEKLLYALKPYLADEKKAAVDNVIKAAKMGDLLEMMMKAKKQGGEGEEKSN